jgi:putative NIF3 family GTP cyclohydrolase 1 type 2
VLPAGENGGTPVWDAIRAGIAIYSPHTALDAADGGTNDVLAELAGVKVDGPFEWVEPAESRCKVVVFVPPAEVDKVADAMFAAGAGRIGEYSKCSYRHSGTGTFLGGEASNPSVGQRGRYETVNEVRLETIVPAACVPAVIAAMRGAHSYEEPAFDVYPLKGEPARGIGRVGSLARATTLASLARTLKKRLSLGAVEIVGDGGRAVQRAALCVGSAGRMPLERAAAAACDVVITGELRHHDALAFRAAGLSAVLLGHWASERPALDALASRIRAAFTGLTVTVSAADRAPTSLM